MTGLGPDPVDPVDWVMGMIELLKRLDQLHDQLVRIADSLEAIEDRVAP